MNEYFANLDISLNLKKLGFNNPCFGYYSALINNKLCLFIIQNAIGYEKSFTHTLAPLWEQCFDFFLEKYNLKIEVKHSRSNGTFKFDIWRNNQDNNEGRWERLENIGSYHTRYLANIASVNKAIETIKNTK